MLFYSQFETLADAAIALTIEVAANGETVEAPDWNTRRLELPAVFELTRPLDQSAVPKSTICNDAALFAYVHEIIDGTMDAAVTSGKEAYTYHSRMVEPVDQIAFVVAELRRNADSNRAVITIRRPDDCALDDQPCLQLIQFKVYGGRLNMATFWRSRDLFKALYMNCFALIRFGATVANAVGLPFGTYTDHSEGLHIYERDWDKARQIANLAPDARTIPADDFWIDFENPFGF